MPFLASPLFFPRNNQVIISHNRRVHMHVVCSPVADLMFRNIEEQYGDEAYETGPAGRENPR